MASSVLSSFATQSDSLQKFTATKVSEVSSESPPPRNSGQYEISNEEIKDQIYKFHDPTEHYFETRTLFDIVEIIFKRSTQIVDHVMEGDSNVLPKKTDEWKNPKENFTFPMCILEEISFELSSCKDALDAETAHESTLTILKKLKQYSWEAKAVLTLVGFATEFRDFWLLVELDRSYNADVFTPPLEILKRTPVLAKTLELRNKLKSEVSKLKNLIKKI